MRTSSTATPCTAANAGTDERHPRRPVAACRGGAPARGTGCRSRRASAPAGTARAASRTSGAPLNVTMPEKLTYAPRSRQRARLVGPAGEAVEHRARRDALGVEDVERVVPRLAGVDHERQADARWPARSAPRTPPAGRRGASGRSGSRARTRRRRPGAPGRRTGRRSCRRRGGPRGGAARRWRGRRRSGRRRRAPRCDVARSQPTVTIVVTPAARRLGDEPSAASAQAASRWQCESSQPAHQRALIRGNSGAPLVTGSPPG